MATKTSATNLFTRLACAALLTAAATGAQAAVINFGNAAQLTNNFTLDVFPGDSGTQFRDGYNAANGFKASAGGFVHFNNYDTANSMRFIAGPVFLNSFMISSQWAGGGAGASNADNNGGDYTLQLYDDSNALIHSATLVVGARGSWDEVELDIAGVRTMRILATWSAPGVYDGWWPNIDHVRFNEAAQATAIPEPGALALVLAALAGAAVASRRASVRREVTVKA